MALKRFKIYNKETLDTYIEDTQDCYSNGDTKTYWFGENEDFCDLFKKLNELAEENEQLKSEINMLKTTIGRNEGYIDRLTHKGEWR